MKKVLLFGLSLLMATTMSFAQDRTVSGKVTSSEDGSTLPGVNVVVKGTTQGGVTDIDGNYKITVPEEGGILVFSFIGLETQEVEIGSRSVIDLQMASDVKQLSEVIVTAFGIEKEKKALTYAAQDVQGARIAEAGTPNVVNALQGKIAGVQVNQSSGMPGASALIRVRGSNSFTANNQPLFVVDGMPISSGASSSGGVQSTDVSSRALDINPDDIETISVLKGAAAAALYGLRASNGVVLITTKSGKNLKKGQTIITVGQNVTIDQVSRLPELQSTYAQGSNGNYSPTASTSWGPRINQLGDPAVNSFATGDGQTYVNNIGETVTPRVYDNVSPMFETGVTSNTNLAILGKSQGGGSFGLTMGYTNQTGVIPTTGMERLNAKLSGEHTINDKLKVGATVNFVNTSIDKLAGGSNLSNVLFTTYWAPRSYDLWGTPYATEDDPYKQIHYRGAMDNPRWSLEHNSFNENIVRSFGSLYTNYKIIEGLTFNYRLGYDAYSERQKEVYSLGSGFTGGRSAIPSGGQIVDFTRTYMQINSNASVSYTKQLGSDINIDAVVGNEVIDIRINDQQQQGNGITVGGFDNIANTSTQITNQNQFNSRQVGFYGQASVSWRDMLFLNLSGRQDYTSVMPRGNRSFFYPSAGLSFVFTEALGLSTNSVFNFGKVRMSYAEVGQAAIAPHSTEVVYFQGRANTGFTNDGINFPFNGIAGFQQSNVLRNPDLSPQNTISLEAGVQLSFFESRINLDVNYFKENTADQIFTVPIARSSGFSSELRNAGELQNTGWEIQLSATPVKTSWGLTWDFSVNYTSIQSEVIALAPGVENIFLGGFVAPNVRAQVAGEYPVIFGTKFLRDGDNNIVHDSRATMNGFPNPNYGMPIQDTENGVIGNVNPDYELGISTSLSFKGLTLGMHIDMRQGGETYAGNTRLQKLYGQDIVTEDRETPVVLQGVKGYIDEANANAVIIEGTNDIVITRGQQYWNVAMDAIDESNVFSTDFLRLREVNLTYNLPNKILGNSFIKGVSVNVMARNLLLLTDYPNFDPETSVGGSSNFQGLEYVNLPQVKSFGAGVKVKF